MKGLCWEGDVYVYTYEWDCGLGGLCFVVYSLFTIFVVLCYWQSKSNRRDMPQILFLNLNQMVWTLESSLSGL